MVRIELCHGRESMAFIATHLAAHEGEKHVRARNESLARIFAGCWEGSLVSFFFVYFWLFLVIFGYFGYFGYRIRMGNSTDGVFFDRFADWAKGTRVPANTPRVSRVAAMHLPRCVTMHLVEVLVTMRYKRVGFKRRRMRRHCLLIRRRRTRNAPSSPPRRAPKVSPHPPRRSARPRGPRQRRARSHSRSHRHRQNERRPFVSRGSYRARLAISCRKPAPP